MKIIEDVLKISIDAVPYIPGHDDGSYKGGFIDGLEHAQELLDIHKGSAINEILTKYMEWSLNLTDVQVANWEDEEGDFEKTKARIRKEFIEYINQK